MNDGEPQMVGEFRYLQISTSGVSLIFFPFFCFVLVWLVRFAAFNATHWSPLASLEQSSKTD